jgi:hypothetical protein
MQLFPQAPCYKPPSKKGHGPMPERSSGGNPCHLKPERSTLIMLADRPAGNSGSTQRGRATGGHGELRYQAC